MPKKRSEPLLRAHDPQQQFAQELFRRSGRPDLYCALTDRAQDFIRRLLPLFFRQWRKEPYHSLREIESDLGALQEDLKGLLICLNVFSKRACHSKMELFFRELPGIHEMLHQDACSIFRGDPAAESMDEVILAYPGIFAVAVHRCAHVLHGLKIPLLPRLFSEYAHRTTGIDIHPGACIGRNFCIDHGTGIVIGATAAIGANVKLYQGVTLGALSVKKALAGRKRHPTIEDNVVIYAQAVILGGETVVGHDSIIGGNAFLIKSVPPFSLVTSKNEIVVCRRTSRERCVSGKCPKAKEI